MHPSHVPSAAQTLGTSTNIAQLRVRPCLHPSPNAVLRNQIDEAKNRLYLTVSGFWKGKDQFPEYERELFQGVKGLAKGFTMVADAREMKAPAPEVGAWIVEIQGKLVSAGLSRTADIASSAVFKLATARYANESEMQRQVFESVGDSEKWLDS